MKKPILSKTTFLKGVQCKKAVYLNKYYSKHKDPIPEERLVRFNEGHEIGFKAQELFPGGINVAPSVKVNSQKALLETKKLIEQKSTIYEAAFLFEQVLIYLDILVYTPKGWIAYEVKSSTEISDTHLKDIALQYYVMKGCGLDLIDAKIIYLNFKRSEILESKNFENIFLEKSVIDFCISNSDEIKNEIKDMKLTLAAPSIPSIKMGLHCTVPYPCDFTSFCAKQEREITDGLFGF